MGQNQGASPLYKPSFSKRGLKCIFKAPVMQKRGLNSFINENEIKKTKWKHQKYFTNIKTITIKKCKVVKMKVEQGGWLRYESHNIKRWGSILKGSKIYSLLSIISPSCEVHSSVLSLCDSGPRGAHGTFQCTVTLYKSIQHEISRS